jgi:hypothetical protein
MPSTQITTADTATWPRATAASQQLPGIPDSHSKPDAVLRAPVHRVFPGITRTASPPDTGIPTAEAPAFEVASTPIEIWEGKVLSVNSTTRSMKVTLSSKMGKLPDHTASIAFEWIAHQDTDLVRPGAIFYWILYKETRRGSVRNSQELRFRRFPTWSKHQLKRIRDIAETLLTRSKPARQLNPRIG